MEAPTPRIFTPARIVALAFIAIVIAGLAYVHVATSESAVSVPSGAKAGDLTLEPCDYATESGSYAADCGTLVVPENRADPQSRLIALPVKRIRARSANPGVPVFRLQGGPGVTNMVFPAASRFADERDVVLVGFRGVEGSSKLDCPELTSAREHARDFLTEKSFRADAAALTACANRLRGDGVDLAGYSIPQRVDDFEAARRALGYERIDLLSESAGTRTAMVYAWRYPQRIHRSVMIAVNPPGNFLWDAKTTGEQIGRYARLCADDASCRRRTPDLAASIHSADERIPSRWWFLPIREGNVKLGAFFGLMNATTDGNGPLSGPWTIDMLLDAENGDGSGAWFMSLMTQLIFPRVQVWGDVAAVSRSDAAYAQRFFATGANRGSVVGAPGTDFLTAGGRLFDSWPASPDENEYARVRDSKVETLLIGGRLDFATPPQNATRELLPHLPNGREVVLPDIGHSDDFWTYQTSASTHLITTYYDTGRVDTSRYARTPVDFTPAFSHGAIAKILLGSMLGLAALTALSLLWMPLRLYRFGPFGPKAGATLRSVYAIVLGLGGWFLGVLLVLAAFPTVPVLHEGLTVVWIGIPIALGTYWASTSREGSGRSRLGRFAAAAGGALVGAWLGFNVTAAGLGLFAPLLAIPGATVGANLTLILTDIAREWSARPRRAAAPSFEAAAPSPGGSA